MNVWSAWEQSFHNKSWSSLGSSFEIKDSENISWIGENVEFFGGNDKIFDRSVKEADQKLKATQPSLYANAKEAAIERLSFLYKDPKYGPKYFYENAQLIKHLLFIYKFTKGANNYEMFYLKRFSTGICIYFNTYTRKRQVVIPVGIPGLEPVRISIQEFRSWYKQQRLQAQLQLIKALRELLLLRIARDEAEIKQEVAFQSYLKLSKKRDCLNAIFNSYPEKMSYLNTDFLKLQNCLTLELDALCLHFKKKTKLILSRGLYEEKDFLKQMAKSLNAITKILIVILDLENDMITFFKNVFKKMKKLKMKSLRSRTRNGKVKKIGSF